MLYREWNVKQADEEKSALLAKELGAGRLLCDVLVARGLDTPEAAHALLGEPDSLGDPFQIHDMDKAVERIHAAIDAEEPVVIFGDYDVDGITATALLYTCLEALGAQVYYKISSRSDDGYGLSAPLVDQIADHGFTLIITVDNGTSAWEAAQRAKERGVDIVVTDHHLMPETLPDVTALVNPCGQAGSPYAQLSGVGVAFMLAAALEGGSPDDLLQEFGDLAAIGTIADVMRLTGHNRTLVKGGLAALQNTHRPGLAALIEACGWQDKEITVENVSYGIAPRINAAGRMDDATTALRLLLAEDPEEADALVQSLQEMNTARQAAEQEIVAQITAQIEGDPALQRSRVLVMWGEGWHQGIIGIVSSRLVDKYAKPAIVISLDGEEGRGSGRSLKGISLYGAIASCEDILIRFGGHDLAAGLSISAGKLEEFRRRINEWVFENCPEPMLPELVADAVVPLESLSVEAVAELDKLAPCGSGNPMPRFMLAGAVIDAVYSVSEGRHTRLRLKQNNQCLYAVLFGTGPAQLAYQVGGKVDALVTLSVYEGKSGPQVSARAIELRPAGLTNRHVTQSALFENFSCGGKPSSAQRALLAPTREQTAVVYRALRDGVPLCYHDLRPAFARFGEEESGRVLTSLAALEELGLIGRDEETALYTVLPVADKRELSSSSLLQRLEVGV